MIFDDSMRVDFVRKVTTFASENRGDGLVIRSIKVWQYWGYLEVAAERLTYVTGD